MSSKDISTIEEGSMPVFDEPKAKANVSFWNSNEFVQIIQKVIAEVIGTYFLVFVGCGSVALNKISDDKITFPGICLSFGLIVMVMIYSVGHISGAHFNPAVTITFAIFRQFPFHQVPMYIAGQLVGSFLGSETIYLLLEPNEEAFFGTVPSGSNLQSFVMEFVCTYLLMFVISGVATDNRSIGELAGIAIGMTILLDVLIAGTISGGSVNPARSIGPAIAMHKYTGLWIYIFAPTLGAIAGGFTYNLIRFTEKPITELTKPASFLKSFSRRPSSSTSFRSPSIQIK